MLFNSSLSINPGSAKLRREALHQTIHHLRADLEILEDEERRLSQEVRQPGDLLYYRNAMRLLRDIFHPAPAKETVA